MTKEIIMGLDTALQTCAACLLVGGEVRAIQNLPMAKGHAEHLAPMVAALVNEAGIALSAINRVGVVNGPGGFTGIRVGLAFARAMALGTDTMIVGINALEALSARVNTVDTKAAFVAPVIDARRGQVYGALYTDLGEAVLTPFVSTPKETILKLGYAVGGRKAVLVGTGAALLENVPASWSIEPGDGQIDPVSVAILAAQKPIPSAPPAPLYLRPPDAKPPASASVFKGLLTP